MPVAMPGKTNCLTTNFVRMRSGKIKLTSKALLWIVNVLLAVMTVTSGYSGMVDPLSNSFFPIWGMLFMPFLTCSVLLAIADIFFVRLTALVQVAAWLACAPAISNNVPFNMPVSLSEQEEARSFTVMSYNVYNFVQYGRYAEDSLGYNPTLSYVLRKSPDVFMAIEFPWHPLEQPTTVMPFQLDSLYSDYPFSSRKMVEQIFSKYPCADVPMRQYIGGSYVSFTAMEANIQRHRVLLVCVHLESIGLTDSDKLAYREMTSGKASKGEYKSASRHLASKLAVAYRERTLQARFLREQIDSLDYENVVIAGDFNDIPGCHAIRIIMGDDFRNAFNDAGFGPCITYHGSRFYFHIDHILYRGDFKAVDFRRGKCPYSDHYPVEAKFLWNEDAPLWFDTDRDIPEPPRKPYRDPANLPPQGLAPPRYHPPVR